MSLLRGEEGEDGAGADAGEVGLRSQIGMFHSELPNPQPEREVLAPSDKAGGIAVAARVAISKSHPHLISWAYRTMILSVLLPSHHQPPGTAHTSAITFALARQGLAR